MKSSSKLCVCVRVCVCVRARALFQFLKQLPDFDENYLDFTPLSTPGNLISISNLIPHIFRATDKRKTSVLPTNGTYQN